jgi:hypothetical protein
MIAADDTSFIRRREPPAGVGDWPQATGRPLDILALHALTTRFIYRNRLGMLVPR